MSVYVDSCVVLDIMTDDERHGEWSENILSVLIGAQAETEDMPLITRDRQRFQTYFPGVRLLSPPRSTANK